VDGRAAYRRRIVVVVVVIVVAGGDGGVLRHVPLRALAAHRAERGGDHDHSVEDRMRDERVRDDLSAAATAAATLSERERRDGVRALAQTGRKSHIARVLVVA
jgi:hypothetical protein